MAQYMWKHVFFPLSGGEVSEEDAQVADATLTFEHHRIFPGDEPRLKGCFYVLDTQLDDLVGHAKWSGDAKAYEWEYKRIRIERETGGRVSLRFVIITEKNKPVL